MSARARRDVALVAGLVLAVSIAGQWWTPVAVVSVVLLWLGLPPSPPPDHRSRMAALDRARRLHPSTEENEQ